MTRPLPIAATTTVVGALAWLAKVGVIVATDGRITDEGPAALLFGIGGLLLLVGIAAMAVHLTRRQPVWVRAIAAIGGAGALAVSVIGLTIVAGALAPADLPQHITDELSTVLASIGWSAAAVSMLRSHDASSTNPPRGRLDQQGHGARG